MSKSEVNSLLTCFGFEMHKFKLGLKLYQNWRMVDVIILLGTYFKRYLVWEQRVLSASLPSDDPLLTNKHRKYKLWLKKISYNVCFGSSKGAWQWFEGSILALCTCSREEYHFSFSVWLLYTSIIFIAKLRNHIV